MLMKQPKLSAMQRRSFLKGAGVALFSHVLRVSGSWQRRSLTAVVNHLSFYQPELIPATDGAFKQPPSLLAELADHGEWRQVSQPSADDAVRAFA